MAETSFNTRIQNKIDTASNWSSVSSFVPKKGEIIIYSDGNGTGRPMMKIGDGSTTVGNLKFLEAGALSANAGNASTPVYFSSGVPVAITSYGGNAASATKLQNRRTINVGTAARATAQSFDGTSNITIPISSVYEAYLSWGGKTIAGDVTPVAAAMSSLHSANRAQFAKPAGCTIEYSTDGGTTWLDYGASDEDKVKCLSGLDGQAFYAGKRTSGMAEVTDQLRITIDATKCGFYTQLKSVLINFNYNGAQNSQVKIEQSKKGSEDTFTELGTYSISGWSGWNYYPIWGAFGGGATQTSNIAILRFTFSIGGVHATYQSRVCVYNMLFFGTTYWDSPSNMARTGHLYDWDYQQNAIFPGTVKASSFLGTATSVSNSLSINGKSFNGSSAVDVGTIGAAYGGSGKTSLRDSANAFINALETGDSIPVDNDYFVSQYVGGGTTYHRRKFSALYSYMKNKMDSVYQAKGSYLTSIPTASSSTLGGVKVGSGLTMSSDVLNHSNSIAAKTSFGSAATTASANGGSITVTDIKYDAQGHITGSQDRTITLSQTTYTLSGLGGVPTTRTINNKALSNNISLTYSDVGAAASSHTHSAYENQNAFSNVTIGTTTISADAPTDTITLIAGNNITLTPDSTNDKITIAATYTLADLMGSSAKGSTTQPVYWNGSSWQNTTYTLGASVPSGAKFTDTVYTLPAATTSTLGGVIVGGGLAVASDGTVSVENHSQTDTITIAAADWSGSGPYTVSKTVAHSYDTSSNNVVISLPALTSSDSATYEAIATAKIAVSGCSGTTVSFVAYGTKPTVPISLIIAQF